MITEHPQMMRMRELADSHGATTVSISQLKWFARYEKMLDRTSLMMFETSDTDDTSMDRIMMHSWVNPRTSRSNSRVRFWSGVNKQWSNVSQDYAQYMLGIWERNRV